MNALFFIFLFAGLCYTAAFGLALASIRRRAHFGKFLFAAWTGFILQCAGIALRFSQTGFGSPFANPYELFETMACLFVLADIVTGRILKIKFTELFTMPPAAVLTLLPLACPKFTSYMAEHPQEAFSNLAAGHALLAALSYCAMLFAAVFAAMELLQRRALKRKSCDEFSSSLLPLSRLERFVKISLGVAAGLMFVSMCAGIAAALATQINAAMTVKFLAGATLAAMQIGLFASVLKGFVSGGMAAKLSILLFIVALLMLAPIELRNFIP